VSTLAEDLVRPLQAVVKLDLRLQWRYGFYYAAVFSVILWEVVVFLIPDQLRQGAMPYIIFGDSVIIGFFFIAGAVFFEKGERTLFALLSTPVRFGHYLTGKLGTLALLSLVLAMFLVLVSYGADFAPIPLIVGIVLCTLLFLLAGLITAAPFPSMTDWLIPSTIVIAVMNIPLLFYSGLWEYAVFYVLPTTGSLLLLGSAFDQVELSGWQIAYALGYQLLWIAFLVYLARRVFDRYIVAKEGSE
jgi:fluoroquinolone transport system permease protein